jgi:hypothetical protein
MTTKTRTLAECKIHSENLRRKCFNPTAQDLAERARGMLEDDAEAFAAIDAEIETARLKAEKEAQQ